MKYYRTITARYNQRGEWQEEWEYYVGADLNEALGTFDDHSRDEHYEYFDSVEEYDVPDNFLKLDEDEQINLLCEIGYNTVEIPDSDEYKTSPTDDLYRVYTFDINENEDELLITKDYWKAVECAEANKGIVEIADSWKRGWQWAKVVKDFTENEEEE